MNFIQRMTISARLTAGFSLLIALLIVITGVGNSRIAALDRNIETIVHDRMVKLDWTHTIENEVNRQCRAVRTALIASDPTVVSGELAKIENSGPLVAKAVEQLQSSVHSQQGKAALQALTESRAVFKEHEQMLVALIKNKQIDEGRAFLVKDMLHPQTAYLEAIESFAKLQANNVEKAAAESAATARGAHLLMISLAATATLLAIAISALLTVSITKQIGGEPGIASDLARNVAAGDLSVPIALRRGDRSSLLFQLSAMQANLGRVVSNVRQNSESVATASAQIAQGNQNLSARTEQQASALEETAASMEQLSSTVKQNADNARQANQLAQGASCVAIKGGEVVNQVVTTMQGINDASNKIADIISVIDGIAFQTNILALNAAVEAARAGEQGRGFAVVAGEVRSLAGRSADAAKEIKSLINASVERVAQGSTLVAQAGVTMAEVVGSIKRVTDIMGEISAASVEQSAGVAQVGETVALIDQATQQNAAMVEESAAAARSLKGQARQLVDAVAVFKLAQAA